MNVFLMILRGISTLAMNPALGGGGIGNQRTAALLDMLATLVESGHTTHAEIDAFAKEIQALVDQNGEPTRGQWDAMIARDLAARKALDENLAQIQQEMQMELHPNPAPSLPQPGDPNGGGQLSGGSQNLSLMNAPVDPPL